MKYVKNILIILFCMILLGLVGCSNGSNDKNQPSSTTIPDVGSENGSTSPQGSEAPFPLAKEINHGGKNYNYDGWVEGGPRPDCSILVDKNWISENNKWTEPGNNNAYIYYNWQLDLTIPPQDAILQNYGNIINKGGDVEYGEFSSKYLAEAYYVKYNDNEYTYIELYGFFYPEDITLPHQPQCIVSLSYKNLISAEGTINENAFWKAAQSMYIAKGYREDGSYIPYIPGVDGANVWDGSHQGIVPTD